MLEKLTQSEILVLTAEQDENWIHDLKYTKWDVDLTVDMFQHYTITYDDEYAKYLLSVETDNNFFRLMRILMIKSNVLWTYCKNNHCDEILILMRDVPQIVKSFIKYCSRFYPVSNHLECSHIKEMTLKDENFTSDSNMLLINEELFGDSLNQEDESKFWTMINDDGGFNQIDDCNSNFTIQNLIENITNLSTIVDSISQAYKSRCDMCVQLCEGFDRMEHTFEIEMEWPLRDVIYSIGLMTSVAFLLMTLIVFLMVKQMKSSVHGKCTMFHLGAMVIAYSCLTAAQFINDTSFTKMCLINGYMMQYAFLAMFFWLNVMCFDIMLAFRVLRKKKDGTRQGLERKKLCWYSCYGWGGPLIVSLATLSMEYSDIPDEFGYFKPNFGGTKCFLRGTSVWIYLYCPIGLMIAANILMFVITAGFIYMHSRQETLLKSNENVTMNRKNNHRLKMYVNLFILMGVNWVTEVLAWTSPSNKWVFYLTDATTALQGVLVFILFVCKPRVLRELRIQFKASIANLKNRLLSNSNAKIPAVIQFY